MAPGTASRAILSVDQLVDHNRRKFDHANADGVSGRDSFPFPGLRFDVDEFGCIFVPDTLRKRITVFDSVDNVVTHSGRRGNQDSAGPEIGLMDPMYVAASFDRAYVGDGQARRIAKVRIEPAVSAAVDVATR